MAGIDAQNLGGDDDGISVAQQTAEEMALHSFAKEQKAYRQGLTSEQMEQTAGGKLKEFLGSILSVREAGAAILPGPVEQNGEAFIDLSLEQREKALPEKILEISMNNILFLAKDPSNSPSSVASELIPFLKNNFDVQLEEIQESMDVDKYTREDLVKIVNAMRTEMRDWRSTEKETKEKQKGIINWYYNSLQKIFLKGYQK